MYEAGKDGEQGEVMGWWGARVPTTSLTSGAWGPPSAKDDAPVLDVKCFLPSLRDKVFPDQLLKIRNVKSGQEKRDRSPQHPLERARETQPPAHVTRQAAAELGPEASLLLRGPVLLPA